MILKVPQRDLSPLSKNPDLIGKIIIKQNPQIDQPINKNVSLGINTYRNKNFISQQDIVKPVTHQKMSSSFYIRNNNFSSNLNYSESKKIDFMNISRKQNQNGKKSPPGTIYTQENVNKSTPISPKNNEISINKKIQQLPKIDTSTQYLIDKSRKSVCQKYKQIKKKIYIGKTYTPSIVKRKSNIFKEQKRKNIKKDIKSQNSSLKFTIFNTKQIDIIQKQEKKKSKQFQQQTNINEQSPPKQYQEVSTMFNGFIYNRNNQQTKQVITMNTSVKKIKQLLIEGGQKLFFGFQIPQVFYKPPSNESTPEQLHYIMLKAFNSIGVIPQVICIKKYSNCVVMRDKKLCILWNFNGRVYFGEWDKNNLQSQGNKQGIGLEWSPKSRIKNQRQGVGIMKKQNRQIYIGCWKNNRKNGWGKIYKQQSGQLIDYGQFKDGLLYKKH